MATNTIDIEIRARKEALVKELTEAGNLSQKQADKIARNFVKAGQDAEKANRKAAETNEKHWTGAAKKIASALGEGTIPKFEKLSGVGESLGGVMGASALGIAAVTGGLALAGAAALKFSTFVVGTIRDVDGLSASLSTADRERLAPYISSLESANDSLTKMDGALAGLQIQFASTFSPAVEDAANALTGLARAGQDSYDWMNRTFGAGTIGGALFGMSGTGQTLALLDAIGNFGKSYSAEPAPAGRVVKQFSTNDLAASLGMSPGRAAGTAVAPPTTATTRKRTASNGANADEQAAIDAMYLELAVNLNTEEARLNVEAAAEEQRIREQGLAAEAEYRAEQVRLADEASEKQKRAAERVHEANKTIVANVGAFVGGIGSLVSGLYEQAADNAEKGSAREKKARRSAFATAKAAALAQAAINTALGVTQALTLPTPLNYINAAIVGALGAVEIGAIAAKQMPTAHSGRIIGAAPAPDEQPIMALRGEAVMSRSAVERMGGEQAVSEANRGVGGGSGMVGVFSVVYEHRGFDAFASRDLRRPTGALRQAIHGSGTAGLIRRV